MSFDLGDVVPLSFTVRNASGAPSDATSVSVTITLPDGTISTVGPIASTTTGVYDHAYTPTLAGRHGVRWVATGTNAGAFTDAFLVEPTDPDAFISLAALKKHMDKDLADTSDDAEMMTQLRAGCQMIRERIGHVSPVTFTEDRTGRGVIVLDQHPVISVTSVATLPGLTAIPAANEATGVQGWTLDGGAGVLRHTSCFGRVRVAYRAGRSPVLANISLAGLELAAHLWRSSQLNSGGGRPAFGDNETPVMPGSAYALPIRVRELLGLGKNPTSDILVG